MAEQGSVNSLPTDQPHLEIGTQPEEVDDSLKIARPFDPERINVKTVGRTIDLIVRRIDHGEIDLSPDFQRRARIWKPVTKSQLIESLLLRIPLPVFYVAANDKDDWAVVDGVQRLTTIYDFVKELFPLTGLEYLNQLDGKSFPALPRPMQRRIEETEIVIHIIEPGTPDEVMINIFKRINTSGLVLTGQEIRNALNKGPARKFLQDLVQSTAFQSATTGTVRDDRMEAQECVLRFIAFRTTGWQPYASNDLDGFLNAAMRALNEVDDAMRERIRIDFERAMHVAEKLFGRDAFRKRYNKGAGRNPVSKALFESWGVNIAVLTDNQIARLIERKEVIRAAFIELMLNDRFFDTSISSSTGVPQRVFKRFQAIEALIKKVLM